MPENTHPEPKNLDDDLASFADRLLRGEDAIASSPLEAGDTDGELRATVRWLSGTVRAADPDAGMRERIRRTLKAEWEATMTAAQPRTQPWWKRWLGAGATRPNQWRSTRRTQQSYGFVLAGAVILLLIVLFSSDFVGIGGTAAAGGDVKVALLGVGLAVIVAAGVWLALRQK